MNSRLPNPLAPVESQPIARALSRYSVAGFALWGAVLLLLAGMVWWGVGTQAPEYRGGTTGFTVFQALIALVAALFQWRKPNRILPVFGLAWSLYEASSLLVGLMVGMPMAVGGLPGWVAGMTTLAVIACAALHIGGLRGTVALSRG